uniref:Putative TROVE domain containing protein n=1 Tax=viral metagenome TaxID=1070528 RepID=A0A6H1ZCA9_9ZZZZ
MRSNGRPIRLKTYEGGTAAAQSPLTELERAVGSCLLFEDTHYESGDSIAQRIAALCDKVDLEDIGALAIWARNQLKLRHAPLWLALQTVRLNSARKLGSDVPSQVLQEVIQRPDELSETLALYWRDGKKPLAAQLKKGMALAWTKFDAYQLGKWDRDSTIKLKDVMFLTHPHPESYDGMGTFAESVKKSGYRRGMVWRDSGGQGKLWQQVIDDTVPTPDTWEVALSAGQDKKATWERLLAENKLGIMAALMNCRNMLQAGVDTALIGDYIRRKAPGSRALPFQFLSAAEHAPALAADLSDAMCAAIQGELPGKTCLVLDVSGSMEYALSSRSEMSRMAAGAVLGVLLREVTHPCRIFTFSCELVEIANYRGLALIDAAIRSQEHVGTYLRAALAEVQRVAPKANRVVVVTDEQSHDGMHTAWAPHSYLINVASYQPALDTSYGWTRINGFSERLTDWISLHEKGELL